MPRCPRRYQLVLDSEFRQGFIKRTDFIFTDKFIGKFRPVICLYCFYLERKCFYHHFKKLHWVFGCMLFKAIYKPHSGTFIDRCPLIQMLSVPQHVASETVIRYFFYIYFTFSPGSSSSGYRLDTRLFFCGFFCSVSPILLAAYTIPEKLRVYPLRIKSLYTPSHPYRA